MAAVRARLVEGVALVAALCVVASGCSKGSGRSAVSVTNPASVETTGDAAAPVSASIPGVKITGPPGAVTGELVALQAQLPAELVDGLALAQHSAVQVRVTGGEVVSPLEVRFAIHGDPATLAFAAVHVGDDGTFGLLPHEAEGGEIVVVTDEFSVVGMLAAPLDAIGATAMWPGQVLDTVTDFFSITSSPPEDCSSQYRWSEVYSSPASVYACLRPQPGDPDNAGVGELELKSNRGTWQMVRVEQGSPVDYVWAEHQPDWLRDTYRTLFAIDENTWLLQPGGRMTVGFRQVDETPDLRVTISPAEGVAFYYALAAVSMEASVGRWSEVGPAATTAAVVSCLAAGTALNLSTALIVPAWNSQTGAPVANCLLDMGASIWRDPVRFVHDVFGDVSTTGWEQFAQRREAAAGAGRALVVLKLAAAATKIWTMVADQFLGIFAADAASQVVVGFALDPPARVEPGQPELSLAEQAAEAVHDAAAAGDYGTLASLAGPEFRYTFGRPHSGGAAAWWAEYDTGSRVPPTIGEIIIAVLGTTPSQDGDTTVWGYGGWRLGIDSLGVWRYLVAGD